MVAQMRMLSEKDVSRILQDHLTPASILESIGRALHIFSSHDQNAQSETPTIQNPLRTNILTPSHNVLFMPSRLGSENTTSIKVVSVPRKEGDKAGLPATTLLLDETTGETRAVLNARSLTAVRTAAASALALSLSRDATTAQRLLIFGSGAQALWHARLASSLSNNLKEVIVASRAHNERSQALLSELQGFFETRSSKVSVSGCLIEEAVRPGGPVEMADLVCCCTPTVEPLFSADRLKAGAGLSLIGSYKPHMREVDLLPLFANTSGKPKARRIIPDSKSACLEEAGELYHLREHLKDRFEDVDLVELGSLLDEDGRPLKEASASSDAEEVTVFKCVGVGVMDSAISALILREAEKHDIGTHVDF